MPDAKGGTMRKWSIVLAIVVALALSVGVAACGGTSGAAPGADGQTPDEILAGAYAASYDLTAATGGFDIGVTVDADLTQVPADAMPFTQALAGDGIVLSGTFAYGSDPEVADCTVSADIMGQPLDIGMKLAGDGFWLSYADQWYAMPPEAMQTLGDPTVQADSQDVEQLLGDLGLDPVTWFKDLRIVGEETLGGVATIHLTASPDMMKMVNDVFELMRSEEFLKLIDPTGSFTQGLMGSGFPPGADEIEQSRSMIEAMFQRTTVDLWVGKADSMPRKVTVVGHIVPPPGENAEGFKSMDFTASMWFEGINQPVTVEPPASSLPFMDLMNAIEKEPGIFQMFNGALGGSGYGGSQIDRY
jgi:hypothetical protein